MRMRIYIFKYSNTGSGACFAQASVARVHVLRGDGLTESRNDGGQM